MTVLATLLLILAATLGMPLFVALGVGGLLASAAQHVNSAILIVEMNRIATSPNLVAIPLFTLAGVTLATGGAPQRLIRVFNAMFGWLPGGMAVVALTSCAFYTAFSGASGVTILALGGLLYPMLTSVGYGERFSLGLITSSGSIGLLFPPSLPILLYGIVAGVSIDQLFLAGLLPGILLLVLLSLYSIYTGTHTKLTHYPFTWRGLVKALREGVWDLLMPVGVVAGIVSGTVTASEAAACTAAYVLLLDAVIHRHITTARQFYTILKDTCVLVGSILIILCVAMGLTNLLIDSQIPMHLLATLKTHIDSPLQFLLLLNLFLLAVGFMMDIFSAIVVVVPLILPLANRYGVDPVHLGIIFLANLEIGYIHPPVGINLFLASQRFNKPILQVFRATLPFLGMMLIWLLIVTYIPAITLWWK